MATKKYPLGIAFSGGGAKAAAHCGALQALKEYGIKPDVMSGTSAGALVAARSGTCLCRLSGRNATRS